VNSDDHPFVEYRAPRDLVEVGRAAQSPSSGVLADLPRRLEPPSTGPLATWPYSLRLAARARSMAADGMLGDAASRGEVLRRAGLTDLADSLDAVDRRGAREARIAELLQRASTLAGQRDAIGARAALEAIVGLDAATPAVWRALCQARLEAGDEAGASEAADHALASLTGSERVEPLLVAATVAWRQGRTARALERVRELQTLSPLEARGYDLEARIRVTSGDRRGAAAAIERGLARIPTDPTLLTARRALASTSARP
jgi:predicted Zn-dependent protease